MLRFWVPMSGPFGPYEEESYFPPEAIPTILPMIPHEAGHAEVALHLGAQVLGIAVCLGERDGFVAHACYYLPEDLRMEDRCMLLAAGSAGEELEIGHYTDVGATGDRRDLREFCGRDVPYEPLVQRAKAILVQRKANFDRVSRILKDRLLNSNEYLTMEILPNGVMGAFVVAERDILDATVLS
jgi:hypothetical protein